MDNKNQNLNMPALQAGKDDETNPQGYPLYPVSEDICNQCKEEVNTNPKDASVLTEPNGPGERNEKKYTGNISAGERDIPGSEPDDTDEITGSEGEENNQYRLGRDMLNNPEEDHGE
jgi:hypothetical protein